ncbi:MAG: metal-dependent phosphohydrolase, partial [Rubripirellula sp.]
MSGANKTRTRQERINSLGIQKPRFTQWWQSGDKADLAIRVAMAFISAIALLIICEAWQPPFAFRKNQVPARELITRVDMQVPNDAKTNAARDQASKSFVTYYQNNTQPIDNLIASLKNDLFLVLPVPSFDELKGEELTAFSNFFIGDETDTEDTPAKRFGIMKSVFADDPELKTLTEAVNSATKDNYRFGLIETLSHRDDQGSKERIRVSPVGNPDKVEFVEMDQCRTAVAANGIATRLKEQFRQKYTSEDNQQVAAMISEWIRQRLADHETLTYMTKRNEVDRAAERDAVEVSMDVLSSGKSVLATAGTPLTEAELTLLRKEWDIMLENMYFSDMVVRFLSYAGMLTALYLLCGSYIFFVDDRELLQDRWKLGKLLALMVSAIVLAYFAARDEWRGELIPLVLASIIAAVVYGRELALLLMAAASLSLSLFLGDGLPELVMLAAACTSCTLLLGRIRSRTHL